MVFAYKNIMRPSDLRREHGIALLETLIGGVVFAIAVVGLASMLHWGWSFAVANGDERVALYLAQGKVEELVDMPFICIPDGGPGAPGEAFGPNASCSNTTVYNESGGSSLLAGESGTQRFARKTCVNFVNDDDPSTPPGCNGCTLGVGTCTQNTRRVTVWVTPETRQFSEDTSGPVPASPLWAQVTLQAVLTLHSVPSP